MQKITMPISNDRAPMDIPTPNPIGSARDGFEDESFLKGDNEVDSGDDEVRIPELDPWPWLLAILRRDIVLNKVLVDELELGCMLILTGAVAVAYTIGSSALKVRSLIAQHVVLTGSLAGQSFMLPLTPT
jgi:hypothetical protein